MKNLKRALSFALASVMVIGMMVVGAGAADFTDAGKIVNDEAVNTLVALNVINGKEDGSYFDPTGTLTRAEAAKLIVYILHGGKAPVIGTKTTPTYTDIKGSWAESYIEYCTSTGIIAGKGNGTFGPTETLTGSALAKMLLVAMNYDAKVFGLTGAAWEINTNIEANKAGLYDELETLNPSLPISRDNAAQMIYNAILAPTMRLTWGQNMSTGEITQNYTATGDDLYGSKFGGQELEGILSYDASADYDEDKGEYTYTITGNFDDDAALETETFTTKTDYTDLFMMNVRALYKVAANGDVTLYGIYAHNSNVIVEDIVGNISDLANLTTTTKSVKVNGTKYNLDMVGSNNVIAGAYEWLTTDCNSFRTIAGMTGYKAFTFKAIDNDDNGKIDTLVYVPFTVEEVTYVGTKNFTAGTNYKFADVNVYDDVAKGDWVKITAAANAEDNTVTIEKIDEIAAKAEAVKVTDGKVKFDGVWYKTDFVTPVAAGSDCKYVEVNGYLFNLESNSALAGAEDFVLITKAAEGIAGLDKTQTAQILKADGTKETVEIAKKGDSPVGSGNKVNPGELYTFKINDDGYYELTAAASASTDFDGTASSSITFNVASGDDKGNITASGTKYIADDAVVFVKKSSTSYAVTTGSALKDTKTSTPVHFIAYDNDSASGYAYVKLAYVENASLGKTTSTYGYVTGDVVKYEADNKFYVEIPVGDETLVTVSKATTAGTVVDTAYGLAKGDVFKYELDADGKVKSITKYNMDIMVEADKTATTGTLDFHAAIVGYADNNVRFNNTLLRKNASTGALEIGPGATNYDAKLTEDTEIIYVDQADKEIIEGGEIRLAASEKISSSTGYYANAKAVVDAVTEEIVLLVVDINNDMLGLMD